MTNTSPPRYSLDTSSLINGHRVRATRLFLEDLIRKSQIKSPPGVLRELEIGGDETYGWAKRWEKSLIMELTPLGMTKLNELVKKYGDPFPNHDSPGLIYRGLLKTRTSADADPEVIALAWEHGWTVLADEASGIRGACKLENIACTTLGKLIEVETATRVRQMELL